MVGLVIVSHSRSLALALVSLVEQVAQDGLPLASAGGVGPERAEFGTDAVEISEAIQSVYSPDGVLVLMDLGSAILSAELALEFLPPEMVPHIRFCAAPLVEGAIAAGVQVSLGSDLETVYQEAQQALLPKTEHFGLQEAEAAPSTPGDVLPEGEPWQKMSLTLRNEHGLHARPAARFVQLANAFDAEVHVANLSADRGPASAKSLNALATLGAVRGHQIEISAHGPEAPQALEALRQLVEAGFGERAPDEAKIPEAVDAATPDEEGALRGVPVSEGIALGPLFHFTPPPPPVPDHAAEDPEEEWALFQRAWASTAEEIKQRRRLVQASLGEDQAAIFDAHRLILDDPELLSRVRRGVFERRLNAAQAWHQSIEEVADSYRGLENTYLQQRAIDVEDVGTQLLRALADAPAERIVPIGKPVILVAQDLTPTETAQLDLDQILGIVTVGGGPTSHSAILARGMGIPAVAGVDASISTLPAEASLAIDGFQGTVWVDPPRDIQEKLASTRETWLQGRDQYLQSTHLAAETLDGDRVEIAANAGNLPDAEAAIKNGAEGIGLLRTEFLYLTRAKPPAESEQVESLRKIAQIMGSRPVIVRTLDIGGDKTLPYMDLPVEDNPFLGLRAIRLSLQHRGLFHTQLRAILQAGAEHNFQIMFPMVTSVEEVVLARQLLDEAHRALEQEGTPHLWPIQTGIMVETPAAALLSPALAKRVDFFSIGTNDLTQYTLAAERGNPNLSNFADALNPAILRLIKEVVGAAHEVGKWVGVCGELAGDPVAVPLLVGLGVDELSMNPGVIPKVKSVVRKLERAAAVRLAEEALAAEETAQVRQLGEAFLQELGF